jgi:hypothetical protein
MPALRLIDHHSTRVHSDTPTAWANDLGERPHIIPRPAPDVEEMQAIVQLQLRDHHLLQPFDVLKRIPGIKILDKEARVRLLIEGWKLRGIPSGIHQTTPSARHNRPCVTQPQQEVSFLQVKTPNNLLSDKYVAISNIAGYDA